MIMKEGGPLNRDKTRSSLLGIVAGYLLYLAYQLFQGRDEPDTAMTPFARYAFIALFVIAGIALIAYAWREWKRSGKEEEKTPSDEEKNSLK